MPRSILLLGAVLLVAGLMRVVTLGDEPETIAYMGMKGCICHKAKRYGNQVKHWKEKDPHSKAYESLRTDESKAVAARMGITDPLIDERCTKCHATAAGVSEDMRGSLTLEDGVTCESCHGPGSKYCKKKIMSDREQAVANGLRLLKDSEERTKVCGDCHNENVPKEFYKKRDFVKDWEPFRHMLPAPKAE